MDQQSALAPLIATRMCHDLASPVGAVANLADMLRDTVDDQAADDLAMLCKTAERSTALLKFFRLVLGSRAASEPGISAKTFIDLAQCQAIPRRIEVEIRTRAETLTAEQAQMMGLLLMVGVSLVGLRGQVIVTLPDRPGDLPTVQAMGEKAALSPEKREILMGGQVDHATPGLIEFMLLADLLGGTQIAVEEEPGRIQLAMLRQLGESPAA
ncbi:MAG: hypothetical protein AAGH74_05260 [Pseudomonadota bacterium]